MALWQPQRLMLSWLGTPRGRRVDSRILDRTGHSPYSYLYGKDLGAKRNGYRPPMNLTTIGHRSGMRHTVALAYFPIDEGWAVVGSAHGSPAEPHWVRNARANSAAWVRLNRQTTPVTATDLADDHHARTVVQCVPSWRGPRDRGRCPPPAPAASLMEFVLWSVQTVQGMGCGRVRWVVRPPR
jgi:deazaflavin-dependent oxidoreductase (nitroreductase family)